MAREEILEGLKNALERGERLESAVQSFISAGYSAQEVQEAARALNAGVISSMPATYAPLPQTQTPIKQIQQAVQPNAPKILPQSGVLATQKSEEEKKQERKSLIILIIIILVALVVIGIGGIMLFGESLLKLITGK